jgi:hypothetical protein
VNFEVHLLQPKSSNDCIFFASSNLLVHPKRGLGSFINIQLAPIDTRNTSFITWLSSYAHLHCSGSSFLVSICLQFAGE